MQVSLQGVSHYNPFEDTRTYFFDFCPRVLYNMLVIIIFIRIEI